MKHQLNSKLSPELLQEVEKLNDKLFAGKKCKSDMGRFLIQFALNKLATAKIETTVCIDGKPVK